MATSSSSSSSLLLGLPEELLVAVLLKLPAESLVVLRGVCKLLDTYVSSKCFRRLHVRLWANRDTEMKHVFLRRDFAPGDDDEFPGPGFAPGDHDPASRAKKLCYKLAKSALDFRRPRNCRFLLDRYNELEFGGCYDGIICFYEEPHWERVLVIYICNPALNECRVISRPRASSCTTKVCLLPEPASGGDYRIVVVSGCSQNHGHIFCQVWASRLSDCCWREMDTRKAAHDYDWDTNFTWCSDLVVHNGCVYWLSRFSYELMLHVLDLHQESVREILLPEHLQDQGYSPLLPDLLLLRYQGSLGICRTDDTHTIADAKLCLMREEEDGGISWGEPAEFEFKVACKSCGGVSVGWKTCGCYARRICSIPAAPNSVGWLMCYDETETTYFWSENGGSKDEPLGKFHIPKSIKRPLAYITADYVPSLVSILPQQ